MSRPAHHRQPVAGYVLAGLSVVGGLALLGLALTRDHGPTPMAWSHAVLVGAAGLWATVQLLIIPRFLRPRVDA